MSELADTSDKAFEKARDLGLDVVLPDDYTLQLDLDVPYNGNSEHAYGPDFVTKLNAVYINFGVEESKFTISKSGRTHCFIRLCERITPTERIALQAALGSDGLREILSLKRVQRGDLTPTLLFEVRGEEKAKTQATEEALDKVAF